jgi:glycosyltransferase involved in cell wall biosynthesis
MRIAYIANYQGQALVLKRPCLHNFSLAARVKIQLMAELLTQKSHEVEVISQGQLEPQVGRDRFRARYFSGFVDPDPINSTIPVHYVSTLSFRYVTGFWESIQAQRLLDERHRAKNFDLILIYNLQRAQIGCALHASRRLGLPVVLQYEDDSFVDIHGHVKYGFTADRYRASCREVLKLISGGTAVSPYLLSQMPVNIPKVLLRGIVSAEIQELARKNQSDRKNWVVFSGTHEGTQGLEQLIVAWRRLGLSDWELHLAGSGPLTPILEEMSKGDDRIVFHGVLNREENARLLCQARIGMNPQDITKVPGSVFAFKIVEYLAAGLHVITTPRGELESELEQGVSYIADNTPEAIATMLNSAIRERRFIRNAQDAAFRSYGPMVVARSLDHLVTQAAGGK